MVIRHITNAFRRLSGSTTLTLPQNRMNSGPPIPQGDWQLIVDREGNLVTDRKPNENDFLARRPVEYLYGGTIPEYRAEDYKNYAEQAAAALDNTVRDFRNKALLDRAIFLLSQTNDGRRLLTMAKKEGFTFVFDTDYMKNEGAVGMLDPTKKLISLKEGRSAIEVALTAKHELQHMEDMLKGAGHNFHDTIKSATIGQRALEANARVSEAVAAIELYEGDPQGPDQQFRSASLFSQFFEKNPTMAQAALQRIDDFKNGDIAAFALPVFTKYWECHDTLDYYDQRLVKSYEDQLFVSPEKVFEADNERYTEVRRHYGTKENYIASGKRNLEGIASNDRWADDQEKLQSIIAIKGKTFLDSSLDLSEPKMTALSEKTISDLDKFITKAKAFIPEEEETLRTNLFASTRTPSNAILTPSPFPLQANGTDSEFQPIKFPDRIDGHELTNGVKSNANIKEVFEKYWADACNYPSQLDRLNMAIWLYNHDAPNNVRGSLSDLVEAGLRVPAAALPQEYILHLSRCAKHLANTGRSDFSKQDIALMQHWRDMVDHGYNPIYGTKIDDPKATADSLKNMADVFHTEGDVHFNHYIKPFIDKIMPAAKTVTPDVALQA